MISYEQLASTLEQAFPDSKITIQALVDDGEHYSVTIYSNQFVGKTPMQSHRLVYNALSEYEIHALQIKTFTHTGS